MTEIPDVDAWLATVMEGQPPGPQEYELHVHPDVNQALITASLAAAVWEADGRIRTPRYGRAAIIVNEELDTGEWRLYANDELLNSGRLGPEKTRILLDGGPNHGQHREHDGRPQFIDVVPLPPRDLTISDWSFTIPAPARYARTYRTSPDGAEIYRYEPVEQLERSGSQA